MSENPFAQQLGELQGRLRSFEEFITRHEEEDRMMREDIRAIRETLSEARGGWKTLMLVGGVAGVMGAVAAKLFPFLGGLPK